MPMLPLPQLDDGVCIDGGDLPVTDIDDVAAEWAGELQAVMTDPIRDAIQWGQVGMFLEYQRRASYAAAQSDPGRATDEYLDDILDERACPRQSMQGDEPARAVMFATPPVVSPVAIVNVANSILAPYTTTSCRYAERSDGWFVSDGTPAWSSHVFASTSSGLPYADPNYPDRPDVRAVFSGGGGTGAEARVILLDGAVAAFSITVAGSGYTSSPIVTIVGAGGSGAVVTAQILNGFVENVIVVSGGSGYSYIRRPPGAMPNTDTYGRWFLLRTPDISSLDSKLAACFQDTLVGLNGGGGTGATAIAHVKNGSILSLEATNAGSGYSTAPIVTIEGAGTGATAIAILSGGSVISFIVLTAGSGYQVQNEPLPAVGATGIAEISASVGGFFVSSTPAATPVKNATFLFDFAATTVDDVYNSLISAVNSAIGFSIRWDLIADPQLAP